MSETVHLDPRDNGVAVVTLRRPEARNAMTLDMVRSFTAVLDEVDRDPNCRVVVLAAEGRAFCGGLDLKAAVLGEDAPQDAIGFMALQELFAGAILRIRGLRQPVVAAVQGGAVGFGFGLALASDVRITDPSATFLVGAVKIGLSAGECGISYHLPRLVGAGRAFEIMLTGRPVDATEALSIGLSSRIVDGPKLLEEALATAAAIAQNSPYAVKHTKQLMWSNLEAASLDAAVELENHVQVVALVTQDFREGATAFAEKRPPRFTGQ